MLTINREDGIIMKKIGDDCMLIEEINLLKEKLERQLMGNDPYEKIYETSTQIDKLLVKYYEKDLINNKKNSLENIFRKDLSY